MKKKIHLPKERLNLSTFTFSQGALQAYADCPRLFQLRYIHRLLWPAPEVEPNLAYEKNMMLGSTFHKLVQQFLVGIPVELLEKSSRQDPVLEKWWSNFIRYKPELEGKKKHYELTLTAPMAESSPMVRCPGRLKPIKCFLITSIITVEQTLPLAAS